MGEVIRCFETGWKQRAGGLEEQDDGFTFWLRHLKNLHAQKQVKDFKDAQDNPDASGVKATPPDQLQIDAALDQAESFLPPESDEED